MEIRRLENPENRSYLENNSWIYKKYMEVGILSIRESSGPPPDGLEFPAAV